MPREDLFSFGYRNPRYFERFAPSSTLHDGPRFGGVADPSFHSGHALPSSCYGACHRVTSVRFLKRRSFRKLPRPRSGTEPMFKWKQSSRFLAIELVSILYFVVCCSQPAARHTLQTAGRLPPTSPAAPKKTWTSVLQFALD